MADPAGIHRRTGGADRCAERFGQRAHRLEALRTADAAAAGYDDLRALQIDILLVHVAQQLDHPGADILFFHMDILADDLSLCLGLLALLEDARAHCADLRTVVGAEDGRHQIAAEGRTGPGDIAALLINIQRGAVRGQAGLEAAGYARAKVAAVIGRADQHACRAVFLHERAQRDSISVRAVMSVFRTFDDNDPIRAMRGRRLDRGRYMIADHDGDQCAALLIRHHAAGGQ